jgi:hypothetical protein
LNEAKSRFNKAELGMDSINAEEAKKADDEKRAGNAKKRKARVSERM